MISYEFFTFTHTMMIRQLHTYPIDLYGKHAHLYKVKHRLNTLPYRCRRWGCRYNGCSLQ